MSQETQFKDVFVLNKVKQNFVRFFDDIQSKGKNRIAKYDTTVDSDVSSSSSSADQDSFSDFNTDVVIAPRISTATETLKELKDSESNLKRVSFKQSIVMFESDREAKKSSLILFKRLSGQHTENSSGTVNYIEEPSEPIVKPSIRQFLKLKYFGKVDYDALLNKSQEKYFDGGQKPQDKEGLDTFFISSIGFSLGLGNLWRFPLKCIEGGGSSFLIAYSLMLLFVAAPIFFFEMALGQFAGRGTVGAYTFAPVAKGVGITNLLICVLMSSYYNAILSWSIIYIGYALHSTPWSQCENEWNKKPCYALWDINISNFHYYDNCSMLASHQFFYRVVVSQHYHEEAHEIHHDYTTLSRPPHWFAIVSSVATWIIICITVMWDFEGSGSFFYFTLFTPFAILYILLITTATLPRSVDGLSLLFKPEWSRLAKPNTWFIALEQVLYTLTICGGMRTAKTSVGFNSFHVNFYNDLILILGGHIFISLLSGVIAFQMIGYVMPNTDVDSLPSDPGLIFKLMSESSVEFGKIFGNFFCLLLFLTFLVVGINTQSGLIRCVITFFIYELPTVFKNNVFKKVILIFIICISGFGLGILFLTPEGYFWFLKIDFETLGIVIIICALTKTILVNYVYGWKNLCEDIYMMIKYKVNYFWILSWTVTCPIILLTMCIVYILHDEDYSFETEMKQLGLKNRQLRWTKNITLGVTCVLVSQIIIVPIIMFVHSMISNRNLSFKNRIAWLFTESETWGPQKKSNWLITKRYRAKFKTFRV